MKSTGSNATCVPDTAGHGIRVFRRVEVQPGALSVLFPQAVVLEAGKLTQKMPAGETYPVGTEIGEIVSG